MERKEGMSSGAIPKGSNITAANTKGNQVKTKSESFRRGLNRQSSNSKLVKTAIVKPYNFAAESNATNDSSGPSTQDAVVNSGGDQTIRSKDKTKLCAQGEISTLERCMSDTKIITSAARYDAHSGIQFLPSPRKQKDPNPFARGGRRIPQNKLIRAPIFQTDAKASSAAETAVKELALRGKALPKPKVVPKVGASNQVQKSLADASKTVLQDTPVLVEKFSGHSGLILKPRKTTRPHTNPFLRSNTHPPPPTQGDAAKK